MIIFFVIIISRCYDTDFINTNYESKSMYTTRSHSIDPQNINNTQISDEIRLFLGNRFLQISFVLASFIFYLSVVVLLRGYVRIYHESTIT